MKDNFSADAGKYAQFRPDYPDALVDFILENVSGRTEAWDCGTGNGQLAKMLAPHFGTVYATDISAEQLDNAIPAANIRYRKTPAEHTDFTPQQFDLVTVAQAVHWFRFDAFYKEVNRTLKDDGLLVITGYSLPETEPGIDTAIRHFHSRIVGPYWDAERRYVDEHYRTIPFPFKEIPSPALAKTYQWTLEQLMGYLYTWSAVKHYREKEHKDPVLLIAGTLKQLWGEYETRTVRFPTLVRAGRKL